MTLDCLSLISSVYLKNDLTLTLCESAPLTEGSLNFPDRHICKSDSISCLKVEVIFLLMHLVFLSVFTQELQHENIVALYDVQVSFFLFLA